MAANNLFNALMQAQQRVPTLQNPIDPRLFAQALREKMRGGGPAPAPSPAPQMAAPGQPPMPQQSAPASAPPSVHDPLGAKIQMQQQRLDDIAGTRRVHPGLGRWAPLAAVLQGVSANMAQDRERKTMDEYLAQYEQQQQERARQEMLALQQEQQRKAEAAALDHQRALEIEEAKRKFEAQYRAPEKPDAAAQKIDRARAALEHYEKTGDARELEIVAPEILENRREVEEQEATAQRGEQERQLAISLIDDLLADEEGMAAATGSIDGLLPSFRQRTVDWENKYNDLGNLLTLDNLDRMSGVLSESDIQLLRSAATAGMNLRSGTPEVKSALQRMRGALAGGSAGAGDAPQPGDVVDGYRFKGGDPSDPNSWERAQ